MGGGAAWWLAMISSSYLNAEGRCLLRKMVAMCSGGCYRARRKKPEPSGDYMTSSDTPRDFTHKRRLLKIVLGVFLAALCFIAAFLLTKTILFPASKPFRYTRLSQPVVKVPFQLVNGLPVVEVMINQRGPYRLVLDTGSTNVHICPCLVKKLGLPEIDTKTTSHDAAGNTREYSLARVDSLRVGQAEFLRFGAVINPIGHKLSTSDTRVDGIIGYHCFRELLLTLDFPNQQLILQRGVLPKPDGQDVFELSPSKAAPELVVSVGQTEVELLIDSGYAGCVSLSESFAKTFSFHADPLEGRVIIASGMVSNHRARLKGKLAFGRHVVIDPIIGWIPKVEGQDMMGMDILKHFVITFDRTNGLVRFSRNGDDPIRIPPVRSIGLIFGVKKGTAAIEVINPNTPAADLGLKVGDQLLTVNGEPFSKLDDVSFSALFEKTDAVRLELMRGKKRLALEVPVVNLIE